MVLHILVDLKINAAFPMQHQTVHELVCTTGQPLSWLNLVACFKNDFHSKGVTEQAKAFINVVYHYANLENAFCVSSF